MFNQVHREIEGSNKQNHKCKRGYKWYHINKKKYKESLRDYYQQLCANNMDFILNEY